MTAPKLPPRPLCTPYTYAWSSSAKAYVMPNGQFPPNSRLMPPGWQKMYPEWRDFTPVQLGAALDRLSGYPPGTWAYYFLGPIGDPPQGPPT